MSVEAKRYRWTHLGINLHITHYKNAPNPGLDVQLELPWFTLGGYLYA